MRVWLARGAFLRAWTAFFESRALAVAVFLSSSSSSDVVCTVHGQYRLSFLFSHTLPPQGSKFRRARHLLCDHPRGQISFSV